MAGNDQPTGRGRAAKRRGAAKDTAPVAKKRRGASVPKAPAAPPSIDINATHPSLSNFSANKLLLYLTTDKPEAVAWALNGLLQATADFSANYCLGASGEKILLALTKLFDEAIGWNGGDEANDQADCTGKFKPSPSTCWNSSALSGLQQKWEKLCLDKLASPLASSSDPNHLIDLDTDGRILEVIVAIMRNLSFVAQNLRLMAYTPQVMRILTGALYYKSGGRSGDDRSGEDGSSSSSNSNNICVNAIQTIINLAPLIDITGRQYFIDRAFLESTAKEITCTIPDQQLVGDGVTNTNGSDKSPSFGMASFLGFGGMALAKQYDSKAETLDANVSPSMVMEISGSLVQSYLAIFPALASILNPNGSRSMSTSSSSGWHRSSVQAVLELFMALMEYPDNNEIFSNIPVELLHSLTELLFIPRLGPDAMDYTDPISNTVVRVMALKFMRYDATIDTDVRDKACEVLVSLTDLSDHSKVVLGLSRYKPETENGQEGTSVANTRSSRRINVRLYDSLMSMIASSSNRGDGSGAAMRLLSNLASVPQNRGAIIYVERKLLTLAAKDANISRIACSQIFNQGF